MKRKALTLTMKLFSQYKVNIIKFIKFSSDIKILWTIVKFTYKFSYWSVAAIFSFLLVLIWELGDWLTPR